ncbi:hypothetical protein BJ508DRAFT_312482 [Ascobolus immersus RN42]|uniref:Uncharacterized protein n=1 Tax=Ascobolus immersus RN42 TaxID=1160509 RepID=A0A3N4HYW8_ASCIM|nr:hypothetical protein BJ508DRAFT_312482 [Ascobolus immersus RN42]
MSHSARWGMVPVEWKIVELSGAERRSEGQEVVGPLDAGEGEEGVGMQPKRSSPPPRDSGLLPLVCRRKRQRQEEEEEVPFVALPEISCCVPFVLLQFQTPNRRQTEALHLREAQQAQKKSGSAGRERARSFWCPFGEIGDKAILHYGKNCALVRERVQEETCGPLRDVCRPSPDHH